MGKGGKAGSRRQVRAHVVAGGAGMARAVVVGRRIKTHAMAPRWQWGVVWGGVKAR